MDNEENVLTPDNNDNISNDIIVNNMSSTLFCQDSYENISVNYIWLLRIEETLPYIENILDSPKRFIKNFDEVKNIELSRKVDARSITYLTQHTNHIRSIDDDGSVIPSRLLQNEREDTFDIYENRFIFSLINRLKKLFDKNEFTTHYKVKNDTKLHYNGVTNINSKKYDIAIDFHSEEKILKPFIFNDGQSIEEKFRILQKRIDDLYNCKVMAFFRKENLLEINGSLNMTNILMKNINYNKATELWDFLNNFQFKDMVKKEKNEYYDKSDLKDYFDKILVSVIDSYDSKVYTSKTSKASVINAVLSNAIDNVFDLDYSFDAEKIKKIFIRNLESAKLKIDNSMNNIYNILDSRLDRENNYFEFLISEVRDF